MPVSPVRRPFYSGTPTAAALAAPAAALALAAALILSPDPASAQEETTTARQETIAGATEGMERHDGFIPFYRDTEEGRILMEVVEEGPEFMYLVSQATGIGSDDLGLDRGEIGSEYLARFERSGGGPS
jgi:hypothetical protein